MELDGARLKDLEGFLESYFIVFPENVKRDTWFFLDEVQKIDGWESFVRSLLDKGKHVYISGSSSRLLSKEVASLLRGRGIAFDVFPLSFREFLAFKGITVKKFLSTSEKSKILNLLNEYASWGSYPEVAIEESPAIKKKILKEILDVTIQRDIIERYGVRNEKLLKLLVKALANSKEFSVHKFFNFLQSNSVKVSKNTLYSYLQALNDCFAVFPLKKFSLSYKEEEQSIPKIYFVDSGLLQAYAIDDFAKAMETVVFIELLRKHGFENVRYFKAHDYEVDFVVIEGSKAKQLIQVCYSIKDFSTRERELKALVKASKNLKCNNLLVVTGSYEGTERVKRKKVAFIPLWKWLLGREAQKSDLK